MNTASLGRLGGAFQPWTDVWFGADWRVQAHCGGTMARVLDSHGQCISSGGLEECMHWARQHTDPLPTATRGRAAVLLHGLGHHRGAMSRLASLLEQDGWTVANMGYASLRLPLESHAGAAAGIARDLAQAGAREVSFVGHSLGGLVARAAMADADKSWVRGRLVLVGSPARGSAYAHALRNMRAYQTLTGACGQSVTPLGASRIPIPQCAGIAVIAGGTGRRGFNPLLAGDNDGVVRVEETRLGQHEDSFALFCTMHTPLASNRRATLAAASFLETGSLAE